MKNIHPSLVAQLIEAAKAVSAAGEKFATGKELERDKLLDAIHDLTEIAYQIEPATDDE